MKFEIAEMERITSATKTRTMLLLLVLIPMFFSSAWGQKDTTEWTPPETIYPNESYSDSLSAYSSWPSAFAWDLSGNWHGVLERFHRHGPVIGPCPSYTEYAESLYYINSVGDMELIVAALSTEECYSDTSGDHYENHGENIGASGYDGVIAVDGSGTVHVTYWLYNYDTGEYSKKYTKRRRSKEWTFMIYMDADNNLEHAGILDLNEMEKVGSSDSVNIVVQMDRIDGTGYPWDDTSNGNWKKTKRFFVIPDSDPDVINSFEVEDLGEMNMGKPATLDSFITWAKREFPARKYCLVLWDHGSGWQKAGRWL